MKSADIIQWLREEDSDQLEKLWKMADDTRRQYVGDQVYLRGLLEISNHCSAMCTYCGIRSSNKHITRYRMSREEILESARSAERMGYDTVVIQAGEDSGIGAGWLAEIIQQIKKETRCAVTLSLGERKIEEISQWKEAGADRYLLRFETSDPSLYKKIRPANEKSNRIEFLLELRKMGYTIGSGVLIGIPGQTYVSLAEDILLFEELELPMIGCGPFIPHPQTPLGKEMPTFEDGNTVAPSELMTYKVLALARLICPTTNIPSTTALVTLNDNAREYGLQRGANVLMPNCTPAEYRSLYEIYPAKACMNEQVNLFHLEVRNRMNAIGRFV